MGVMDQKIGDVHPGGIVHRGEGVREYFCVFVDGSGVSIPESEHFRDLLGRLPHGSGVDHAEGELDAQRRADETLPRVFPVQFPDKVYGKAVALCDEVLLGAGQYDVLPVLGCDILGAGFVAGEQKGEGSHKDSGQDFSHSKDFSFIDSTIVPYPKSRRHFVC